ncbi:TetR/AcrR family transcriptional regulator [Marinobacterium aestuariivivens]|uniref:TetR/AcrR family transcriptional regulator n=1 Tax=Marinobacterium aestuariivivens TaxID=1698799 RepID=A0ABW2A3M6_9GAMM
MARGRPSKKQQILDSARQLFSELGYQGTTVDLVVQTAGVSKPTVYSHFPSKQVLWQAMLEQAIEQSERQRAAIARSDGDWVDAILSAFGQLAAQPEMLAIYRIMLGERHKMAPEALQLFDDFERRLESWCDHLLETEGLRPDQERRFVLLALCREGCCSPRCVDRKGCHAKGWRC